ncbi:hypothetical protein CEUSTIGMA_g3402.t1 [Chlamydomonas eustigma]|uniref:Uncharacterized protein n=1 Tax=Chlamydomonas eustigma TaxID=1157962 RepID=A0A250WZ37_9CHLO|nr:hypothetical protein CEUSTIGMA_g3402.t1 [Chlamydomonas eustigma]|eukprot:GAX75959.1 hypothetical protein CEUSTIGMA_g3402.t1 [Chlamydomonas eustigma]
MGITCADALRQLRIGETAKGKLLLETLVHTDPKDVQSFITLAQACLDQNNTEGFDQAVLHARQAYDLKVAPETSISLAVALGSSSRLIHCSDETRQAARGEAIRILQKYIEEDNAGSWKALLKYNLAVLLAEVGQLDASIHTASSALEISSTSTTSVLTSVLDPDGDGALGCTGRQQLTTLCLVLLGMLMSAKQEHQAALRLLTAAPTPSEWRGSAAASTATATATPSLHTSEVLLAKLKSRLLSDGSFSSGGDVQAAMTVLAQLKRRIAAATVGLSSTLEVALTAQVWQELALLCASSSDNTNAAFCAEQALLHCPWQAQSHHVLGVVHEAAGQAAAAMEAFNTALALDPCHAPSLISLGTMYRRHGTPADLALSRDLLTDALRCNPSSVTAWHQLGLACSGLGHREEAEKNLRTAVGMAAESPALPFAECPLILSI